LRPSDVMLACRHVAKSSSRNDDLTPAGSPHHRIEQVANDRYLQFRNLRTIDGLRVLYGLSYRVRSALSYSPPGIVVTHQGARHSAGLLLTRYAVQEFE
jgi:hypothetical protein